VKMWTYLGLSCPNRPSAEELSAAEVKARIHKVLDLEVNPNPGPIQRGIASIRVSTSGLVSAAFTIISFHYAHNLAQGLGGDRDEPRDANSPLDATRWEARHASSMGRRCPLDLCPPVRGKWKEGKLCLPCLPPCTTPSPHQEAIPLQTWSTVGEC
jgi:hypothetical protein